MRIYFPSINHAMKAKKLLNQKFNVNFSIIRCHTKSGCGFCILIPDNKKTEIIKLLKENNIYFI